MRDRRPNFASKALIERLDREDAAALGIDASHTSYTQLGNLDTATEKARRDAPPSRAASQPPSEATELPIGRMAALGVTPADHGPILGVRRSAGPAHRFDRLPDRARAAARDRATKRRREPNRGWRRSVSEWEPSAIARECGRS